MWRLEVPDSSPLGSAHQHSLAVMGATGPCLVAVVRAVLCKWLCKGGGPKEMSLAVISASLKCPLKCSIKV